MKTEILSLVIFFGGLSLVGTIDRQSAEVTHHTAMEAPRPIFEESIGAPCTWIQQSGGDTPARTACVDADLRSR